MDSSPGTARRRRRRTIEQEVRHQRRHRPSRRILADEHHRLPGAGHRRQQSRGARLAEPAGRRRRRWAHGAHAFKFGGNMLRSQNNILQCPQRTRRTVPVQRPLHQGRHGGFSARHGQPVYLEHAAAGQSAELEYRQLRSGRLEGYAEPDAEPGGLRYEVVLPFIDQPTGWASSTTGPIPPSRA